MDRLNRINSILFTIMAGFIIVTFIIILTKLIIDLFPKNHYEPDTEMISNEQVAENLKEHVRTQVISYNQATLVDSAKEIYIVPISQIKLEEPESIPKTMQMELKVTSSYYRSYGQIYNNIIVLDLNANSQKILFNKRTCIVEYHIFSSSKKDYLFMLICNNDTNKDNILDKKDLLELYLYDFDNQKIEILSQKPDYILKLDFDDRLNQVFVSIGVDRNADNRFDIQEEPVILNRVDIKSKKVVDLINQETSEKLQSIVDGVNQN